MSEQEKLPDNHLFGFLKELEKSSMHFKLADGGFLLISKEDINQIADAVVLETMVKMSEQVKQTGIDFGNLTQIAKLENIINADKDMPIDIKTKYYEKILSLIKSK